MQPLYCFGVSAKWELGEMGVRRNGSHSLSRVYSFKTLPSFSFIRLIVGFRISMIFLIPLLELKILIKMLFHNFFMESIL